MHLDFFHMLGIFSRPPFNPIALSVQMLIKGFLGHKATETLQTA
jgi:hypothetical protein